MDLERLASSLENVALWVEGWISDAALGNSIGVKRIKEAAEKIKEQYCTDGLWTLAMPAKQSYDALIRYAEIAQKKFEKYLCGYEVKP